MSNRSATNLPNIPKTVRLVFSIGIIFLLIMSLLRLALFIVFPSQGHSFLSLLPCFWLGIRYDLRYAGILAVLVLITACFSFLDPFRREAGRRWLFIVVSVGALLVVLFYCVDFAYYAYLSQRLSASVLNYLTDTGISAGVVWQTYPVLRILLVLIAGTWLIRWIIKVVFQRMQEKKSVSMSRGARVGWLVAAFLLLGLGIFGRI